METGFSTFVSFSIVGDDFDENILAFVEQFLHTFKTITNTFSVKI